MNAETPLLKLLQEREWVVFMDEYLVKPWRQKHWEKLAASGDAEKIELLRMAKSAHVVDE